MESLNKLQVLNTLIKHETLTIYDLSKEENLGVPASPEDLQSVLNHLAENGLIKLFDDVFPATYTITDDGIREGKRGVNEYVEV